MTCVFPEQIQEARVRYRNLSRYCARFVHYALKERRRDAHLLAVVATSNYRDSSYYRVRYEDVGEAGVDPVMHYIDHGRHMKAVTLRSVLIRRTTSGSIRK